MINLIGFCGYARSGKNTAAEELSKILNKKYHVDTEFIGFADTLKSHIHPLVELCGSLGIDTTTPDFKEKFRPMWVEWSRVLKDVTEDNMIWVKLALEKINSIINNHHICMITDVRYDYEVNFIKNYGGTVIYINRPLVEARNHEELISFGQIANKYADDISKYFVNNNVSIEELGLRCYDTLKINNKL